jgi:hypothetical protein
MAACLRLYSVPGLGWTLTHASEVAAIGAGHGGWHARNLRRFVRAFIQTGRLPETQYSARDTSVLEDEHPDIEKA